MDEEEKAKFQEDREAERGAIESGDFEAWKSLMEERILRMQERLTEEEFTLIHERHKERSQNGEHAGGFGQGKEWECIEVQAKGEEAENAHLPMQNKI